MMRLTKISALAALAYCVAGSSAFATTITQTADTSFLVTDLNGTTPQTGQLSFNLFDSNLGTLNSVTITLTGSVQLGSGAQYPLTSPATLTNNSASTQSFTFSQDTQFFVGSSDSNLNAAVNSAFEYLSQVRHNVYVPKANVDPAATTGTYTYVLGTGQSAYVGPLTASAADTESSTDSNSGLYGYNSAFEIAGGGADTLAVSTVTNDAFTGAGGNIGTAINTYADAAFTITYDYTPTAVPEPISLALVGGGLIGLGGIVRRRNKR